MTSLADVANDIKGLLEDVKTNTSTTATRVQQTNTKLDTLNNKVDQLIAVDQNGFTNLSQGLAVLIDEGLETIHLLDVNRQQNDTIICWLSKIAEVECQQLHRLDTLVDIERAEAADAKKVRRILELVHAREALEVEHAEEMEAHMERCCPTPPKPVEPCFDPCKSDDYKPYKPKNRSFTPLHPEHIG